MRSFWPISLSLFDIIVSYFYSKLYSAIFVPFEIFALLSSTCLCILTLPGIKIEVFGTGHELLQVLHWLNGEVWGCVHWASTWSESMLYVTSLTADCLRGSSVLLSGLTSPRCQFLGRTMSLELVFIIVYSRCLVNVSQKYLSTGATKRFCCHSYGTNGSMKL